MNVLVTGGSRGLGLEIVRQLLARGDNVLVLSRTRSTAFDALQAEYAGQSDRLRWIECDLGQPETIPSTLAAAGLGKELPLHGLVNNAAVAYDDLATNLDLSRLEAMYRVNVFAPLQLTKYAIRNMLLHKIAGSIVHVSSVCAHTGYKGLSMYGSTKGALEAYSKNLAREWGRLGIRSNCVVPGFMETDMSAALDADQRQRIYGRTALRQATEPACVAAQVIYLLSDQSRSVTGQNFIVDAGTV
jgi:3-oxoacyl-[acyl-carrier protein] reductase